MGIKYLWQFTACPILVELHIKTGPGSDILWNYSCERLWEVVTRIQIVKSCGHPFKPSRDRQWCQLVTVSHRDVFKAGQGEDGERPRWKDGQESDIWMLLEQFRSPHSCTGGCHHGDLELTNIWTLKGTVCQHTVFLPNAILKIRTDFQLCFLFLNMVFKGLWFWRFRMIKEFLSERRFFGAWAEVECSVTGSPCYSAFPVQHFPQCCYVIVSLSL